VVGRSLPFIMTHKTPGIRLATTAIAAVLALSSAQLLAQTTTAVPDSAPAVTIPSEPLTTSASDPLAPEPTIVTPKASKSTTTKRAASVARPAKAAARTPVTAPVAAPVPSAAKQVEAALGPVAAAEPAPPPPAQVAAPVVTPRPAGDSLLPIAAALGLGLLGMILVGLALRRRRRRNEEEEFAAAEQELAIDEAPAKLDPLFAKPAVVAAAASAAPAEFLPAGAEAAPALTPSDCVDAAPGSHVEAACDGPTEDNPSLSLKKRLKRAHFFDEREQLAAAGLAVPVAADAGLPDAVVVPEPAPAPSAREPA